MKKEIIKFENLAKDASNNMGELYHAPGIIPCASKMIELVQQNQGLRSDFVNAIIRLWESTEIENEVIEFCCHALKWDELKEYFTERFIESKENEDWRAWQCLSNIVESFNPDWEDATDFYGEYFNI